MASEQQSPPIDIKEPFVGPRPFGEKDEEIFFGRDHETSELVSLIISHPVVLLYSQSGAGKTSLLHASLLPLLKRRKLEVLPIARVRGRVDSFAEIQNEANIYVYNSLDYLSAGRLNAEERARTSLASYLPSKKSTDRREVSPLRVVIFDQFEELFTTHPERFEDRLFFFEDVRAALELDPLLRVVFAMREDFIAELDPYTSILPEKLQTRYRLLRLNEHTARVAIEKPVERANQTLPTKYVFEPEAADKIVDNLRTIYVKTSGIEKQVLGPFIEPVHLQVVCRTIWRKLNQAPQNKGTEIKEFRITKDAVEEIGDVNKALSEFYEESLHSAVEAANREASHKERQFTEGALRAWFGRTLITPEGTRGTVFSGRNETTVGGIPEAAITELESQRLIRAELRGGEVWYELSHDRFIQPIRDSNDLWLRRQPVAQQKGQELEAKAAEWARLNKSRRHLLNRAGLEEAKHWIESPEGAGIGYSETLFAFIQASQVAQQQRRMKVLFAGSTALLFLLITMTGLSVYAFQQRAIAVQQQTIAEQQRARAEQQTAIAEASQANAVAAEAEARRLQVIADEKSKDAQNLAKELEVKAAAAVEAGRIALEQKEEAIVARSEAKASEARALLALEEVREQENIALSREVAAHSVSVAKTDPELSLLLALEASKIRRTEEAEAALRSTLPSLSNIGAVLRENIQPVTEAMFTTGSDRVITISAGRLVKLWDVKSGQLIFSREGGVTLSPNGRFIMFTALGGYDVAQVSEMGSGREVRHLPFTGQLTSAVLSPDGKFAAIGDGTDTLLFDVDSARQLAVMRAERSMPGVVNASNIPSVFSPDGTLLVTIGRYVDSIDKISFSQLQVWDARTGQLVWSPSYEKEAYGPIAFSPDGRSIVVGGENQVQVFRRVEIFGSRADRAAAGRGGFTAERVLPHNGVITDISFSPGGDRLVIASTNNTASVWDTATWQSLAILSGHTNTVRSANFRPDGEYIVTASFDNTARVWDAKTGRSIQILSGHSGPVTRATFSPDGRSVVTASEDNSARVWLVNREVNLVEIKGHSDGLYTASFSPDGGRAVTASQDGTARIWEVATGNEIHTLRHPNGSIYCAAFSPDGRSVATAGGDGTARIWDASNGRGLRLLRGHESNVYWVSFSSDGKLLATTGYDQTVRVWEFDTGQEIKVFNGPAPIKHVVFSPDGRFIAAAVLNGTALVWELQSGKIVQTLRGRGDRDIFSVEYSPDGRYILTSGFDFSGGTGGSARIWVASSGQVVFTLVGHKAGLFSATFSRDGKYIVTGSKDNTARVWEAGTGKMLAELRGHTGAVNRAELSADDMHIITSSDDGTARIYSRIWFAPLDELLELASKRVSRSLSNEEKVRFLHKP